MLAKCADVSVGLVAWPWVKLVHASFMHLTCYEVDLEGNDNHYRLASFWFPLKLQAISKAFVGQEKDFYGKKLEVSKIKPKKWRITGNLWGWEPGHCLKIKVYCPLWYTQHSHKWRRLTRNSESKAPRITQAQCLCLSKVLTGPQSSLGKSSISNSGDSTWGYRKYIF